MSDTVFKNADLLVAESKPLDVAESKPLDVAESKPLDVAESKPESLESQLIKKRAIEDVYSPLALKLLNKLSELNKLEDSEFKDKDLNRLSLKDLNIKTLIKLEIDKCLQSLQVSQKIQELHERQELHEQQELQEQQELHEQQKIDKPSKRLAEKVSINYYLEMRINNKAGTDLDMSEWDDRYKNEDLQQADPKILNKITEIRYNHNAPTDFSWLQYFPNVRSLTCKKTVITSLALLKNFKNIAMITFKTNCLNDISDLNNMDLIIFHCENNPITSVNINNMNRLKMLSFTSCSITDVTLQSLRILDTFICDFNNIREIILIDLPVLFEINCSHNEITILDVTGCPTLRKINCEYNNGMQIVGLNLLTDVHE